MFLENTDRDLVGERTWLAEFGIKTYGYVFLFHSPVEFNRSGAPVGTFWVMTEHRAKDAKKCVLHVELFDGLERMVSIFCLKCVNHDAINYTLHGARMF